MNLEPFIQSEVNQKEKNKYHMLMHIYIYIYEIQKNGADEPDREQACEHSGGGTS